MVLGFMGVYSMRHGVASNDSRLSLTIIVQVLVQKKEQQ